MARSNYLFTSESVSEGHPDKVCDRISDEIVDLIYREAKKTGTDAWSVRVACETLATTNRVVIAGEVRVPDTLFKKDKAGNVVHDASGAPVIGFNVRANAPARNAANQKGVDIRYYSVIYDLVDDVKAAASGLLSAEIRENFIGYATIKEVFKVSGVGKVAGCLVTEGVARRSAGVRLLRDDVVIHEGTLKTLKRFKDEVAEVQSGQECGMAFENYDDIRPNDVIEIFEREEVERTLE